MKGDSITTSERSIRMREILLQNIHSLLTLANDPGGDHYVRHLDRLIDMYLDEIHQRSDHQWDQ